MKTYQGVLLICLTIGIVLISINVTKNVYNKCPQNKTIYKYIPRTFREDLESPVSVSELFGDMFAKADPWVGGFTFDRTLRTDLNQYFVSQS